MHKTFRKGCAIVLLLLMCGCKSYLPAATSPVVVGKCQPPPPPAAWFMAPQEPNLSQRMLYELSASPTTAMPD